MLYLIGIGLCDEKDITVKGLEAVKKAKKVYLEDYTSFLQCTKQDLETFYGRDVISADRQTIENGSQKILDESKEDDIAVLIIGDPLSATTHSGLLLEAYQQKIPVTVIHNASVLTAIGQTGLQLYKFGRVSSIPYHETDVPYEILDQNKKANLHTLFLLDLSPKDNKFISTADAAKRLLAMEEKHQKKLLSPLTTAVACARLGTPAQQIIAGPLSQLSSKDLGPAPHCLVIPGELHFMEEEWIKELNKR